MPDPTTSRAAHPFTFHHDQEFHSNVRTTTWCGGTKNPNPKCPHHHKEEPPTT